MEIIISHLCIGPTTIDSLNQMNIYLSLSKQVW